MRRMFKVYNAKGLLIYQHKQLTKMCKYIGMNPDTVWKHFNRHPQDNSYGVHEGHISAGKVKYIIMRNI